MQYLDDLVHTDLINLYNRCVKNDMYKIMQDEKFVELPTNYLLHKFGLSPYKQRNILDRLTDIKIHFGQARRRFFHCEQTPEQLLITQNNCRIDSQGKIIPNTEEVDTMISLYKQGLSLTDIGRIFGISRQAVSLKLKKEGFHPCDYIHFANDVYNFKNSTKLKNSRKCKKPLQIDSIHKEINSFEERIRNLKQLIDYTYSDLQKLKYNLNNINNMKGKI